MKLMFAALIALFIFPKVADSQSCSPPAIQFNTNQEILLTPEQEMYLGEAILEKVRNTYGALEDPEVNAYLSQLGDRISRHLPNTGIKFRFMVSDYPSTNAFAFPGGIIMVTRKMINFVKTEDELAGVVAHELGHATVRHGAIDFSRLFREVLNVSKFGDRNDVLEKYNQLLDRRNTKTVKRSSNHQDKQQIEADELGMYALVAAGYDGNQFPQFWTRLTRAKTRSGFADFFSASLPADTRLKLMLSQFKALPDSCRDRKPVGATKEFEDWRSVVTAYDNRPKVELVPGLVSRKELVPLRSDVEYLKFSPNGEFLVSQDSSTITVLKRDPLRVLFTIPANDARPAEFSPDSAEIITITQNLYLQRWNIDKRRLVAEHEISIPDGYWQTRVSPTGNVVAAYHYNGDLIIYDIKSGSELFRKKKFYLPRYSEYWTWILAREYTDDSELVLLGMKFSPDGKYLLAGRQFSRAYIATNEESIVVNVAEGKEVNVGANIKDLIKSNFGFLTPDKIVGRTSADIKDGGIFSFPGGERLEQFDLGGALFTKSGAGDYLVVRPVVGAAVGVFDLKLKKYVFAGKKSALDVFGSSVVAERKNGELAIYTIGQKDPIATVELPRSEFGRLRTVSFSDNGELLVASDKSRGAVWDLKTGDRRFHLRSFRGNFIADDGKIYADFPAAGETPRSIATIDVPSGTVNGGNVFAAGNARQHGRFIVIRGPLKDEKEKDDKDRDKLYVEEAADRRVGYRKTVTEVRDALTGATLWTREFKEETPWYYINPNQNAMALVWRLKSKAANEILSQNPQLDQKVQMMEDVADDFLIQIVDPTTGSVKGYFLLETGEGSFSVQNITVAGDLLVVDDTQSRQLVFSISSGSLIRRFFGTYSAINDKKGLIALENVDGRLSVLEIASGREIGRLEFRHGTSAINFSLDGRRLFVLTNDQVAYTFDTEKMAGIQ